MGKAAIMLTTGLEDTEKVTVALLTAVAAAEQGRPTLVFMAKEAARLGLAGVAVGTACADCPPIADLMKRLEAAGGRREDAWWCVLWCEIGGWLRGWPRAGPARHVCDCRGSCGLGAGKRATGNSDICRADRITGMRIDSVSEYQYYEFLALDYDLATSLLRDLQALAERHQELAAFRQRFAELRALHQRKASLLDRFGRAGLPS